MEIMKYFIFICIILHIKILAIFSISLKYPHSLYLSNGNIFIIYEKGVSIYDHLYTTKIEDIINFPDNEFITSDDLSRITIALEDSYIFSIIKDKIYIFDDKGSLLFHNDTLIVKGDKNPIVYSLSIIKKETAEYNYIISFFDNSVLYSYSFQYKISSNENYLINNNDISSIHYGNCGGIRSGTQMEMYFSTTGHFDKNSPLSCQFLIDNSNNVLYVCFFTIGKTMGYGIYNTTQTFMGFGIVKTLYSNYMNDIECIKSVVNYNHTKALFGLYSSSGILKTFFYDANEIDNIIFNGNFGSYQCKRNYFGLNIYYYKQNEQYVNSCTDLSGNLLLEIYDKNLDMYDYFISQKSLNNKVYSILYSNCTDKYFLISDKKALDLLDGDKEELDEIKNNFKIETCFEGEDKDTESEDPEILPSTNQNSYEEEDSKISMPSNNNNQYLYEDSTEKDEYDNDPIMMKSRYQNIIDKFLGDIQQGVLDEKIDNLINNEYETNDYFEGDENFLMQITTPYNQMNKEYENISTIHIDEKCQEILKEKYNLTKKNSFLIFKYEYHIPDINIPLIGYDVLHPITKERLDLKCCEATKVDIDIPVSIDESNLEKHCPQSDYYNDICLPCSNEGVDLTIYDRKKEYNYYNMSICPKNCEYSDYNSYSKKVSCHCEIQTKKSPLLLEDIIDTNKVLNNFVDIKSISNIEIIKCYKVAFAKIKSVLLSYVILVIILIFIIAFILFFVLEYKLLFKIIDNLEEPKEQETTTVSNGGKNKNNNINNNKSKIKKVKNIKIKKIKKGPIDLINKQSSSSGLSNLKLIKSKELINKNNNTNNNNINYNDYEMNSLSYKEAIEIDKRTSVQIYISLVRTKNILIFSFYPVKNDYNSRIIKICLFLFSFALYLFTNSLFYNDKTMHKIYEDEGIFNFVYLIPQMIYSTLISSIINILIRFLALSEKNIVELKREKNAVIFKNKIPSVKKCLTIKFILYFILSIIFLTCFWFYLLCFGAIYKNTQVYLLKESLINFSISIVYPFIIYFIPCIFRINVLKYPENCYKLSLYAMLL